MEDPLLDKDIPREYVLYACAVGTFGEDLDNYWNTTLAKCGRNGAHSVLPHITLCSFFTVSLQSNALNTVLHTLYVYLWLCILGMLKEKHLLLYISDQHISLFNINNCENLSHVTGISTMCTWS